LSASQARFQRLADNTPGIIYRYHRRADGSDRFSYLSAAFREIWELEPEAAIADSSVAWSLVHPEDQATLRATLSHSAQTLTSFKADYRITTPSGQQKWLQVLARPEREANGDYLWDGVIVDVTEQVATQKALRESEALNRAILAALPDLLIRMRRDGMCLDMQYPGHFPVVCPKERHVGRLVQDTLTPAVAVERMQAVERALATGEMQIYEYQLPIDGVLQWEEARVVPMQNDEVLVLVRDIDDRKRAEAALQQSETLNRAIVDALPDMFTRISVEGMVLDVHHPTEFPALLPSSKAIGRNLRDFLPTHLANQRIAQVKRAIATQQTEVFEYQLGIDGQLRWEESRVVPFTRDEALVLIRDIDERRRAEEEVRRLNQVLADQNQRLEELVEQRTAELITFMNALPDQIFVVDRAQNTMTFGNQVVTEFAQMTHRQDFEGKSVYECFAAEQAHIYETQNHQVFQTGEILHIEEAIKTPQGRVHLDTYKIPLKRPDGEVYALIGTSRDVTELVEARQALEHQAEQLAATNQELQSFLLFGFARFAGSPAAYQWLYCRAETTPSDHHPRAGR
jgi:PAS domain S-box-containing protein